MQTPQLGPEGQAATEKVLGYLNFSAGATDPQFLAALNQLFREVGCQTLDETPEDQAPWRLVGGLLEHHLAELSQRSEVFRDSGQAQQALQLTFQRVLPAYLEFHRDLLFHQASAALLGPLMVGRVCEMVLREGLSAEDPASRVPTIIARLNDYIGHRPVAVLQTQRREPYAHEWVRPVPLYIEGAGVACGRYQAVVERALELLAQTDEDLLLAACFDPAMLQELAFDPRAYDFDHPVNKRPNYQFGQWDPHHLDNNGRYRRYVVQQVTLDALMNRTEQSTGGDPEELLVEAAAVLAGTVLMATGISGGRPDTHDSVTTLVTLLPRIAHYRDEFYQRLIGRIGGAHGKRLRLEEAEMRQPFGSARQHLNAQLARRRAMQLEHVQLARNFARMGYPEAAARQADVVPVASARLICRSDCALTEAHRLIDQGELAEAAAQLPKIVDLLQRAIQCGAVVDPWNVLGFDAQFSLFPSPENSVRDHRVDELVELMEQIFTLASRVWSEASAANDLPLCESVSQQFQATAEWWFQFAVHEVSSVDAANPRDLYQAARHVAEALHLWHQGGAASGDVRFWAPHAEMFDSPKAYALVIEALLERGDFVASMALLVHWLGQWNRVGLQQGDSSFFKLTLRWTCQLTSSQGAPARDSRRAGEHPAEETAGGPQSPAQAWQLLRKLLDYFEANAEELWRVPDFELGTPTGGTKSSRELELPLEENDDDEDNLFRAAYENVVFHDSTDDGIEGSTFEYGDETADELEREAVRISQRLAFLTSLAQLWKLAASRAAQWTAASPDAPATLLRWFHQAEANRAGLLKLLDQVSGYRLTTPSGEHDSLVEFDRRRSIVETLLERITYTSVETSEAARLMLAGAQVAPSSDASLDVEMPVDLEADQQAAVRMSAAAFAGNASQAAALFPELINALQEKPLLYVPLGKGGDPRQIVAARVRQQAIQNLLAWLPRLGLLSQARELIDVARQMEHDHPAGRGAVTEFDDLFEHGYVALVESIVASSSEWDSRHDSPPDAGLVSCLEQMTQVLVESWLAHSRTLRLSVLEKVQDERRWNELVEFIREYGGELFTQRFMHMANLRSILHQGVDAWLTQLEQMSGGVEFPKLLAALDGPLPRKSAIRWLSLILEAVIENYAEYRDYNATTTQSDRGEMLYSLLDFVRLRINYDRVAWNLKPVILAHQTLVRRGRTEAAEIWRRALSERFSEQADQFITRLHELQRKYAMRMPSIGDRLAERFVMPMTIDRVCALVEPALQEARNSEPPTAFHLLEQEASVLSEEPTGVGFDLPPWLAALEEEVERARQPIHDRDDPLQIETIVAQRLLTLAEVERQLDSWTNE